MKSGPLVATDGPDGERVLTALKDEACRAIVESLADPSTAQEISETCEIPLSTTYRKVKTLTEAGLLEEHLDIRAGGKHTNRYVVAFDHVDITLEKDGGMAIDLGEERSKVGEGIGPTSNEIRQKI